MRPDKDAHGGLVSERELARLAALEAYRILDTAPEQVFEDIVSIAAQICDVPMAMISLVDGRRQWFKASLGVHVAETPRDIAFCAHAIQQESVFAIEDAAQDPRFANNPLVTGEPNLRFYAGAPLLTANGLALGTLCVLDDQPRILTVTQDLALRALARQVMAQLDLRKALSEKHADQERYRQAEERLRRAQEAGGAGSFSVDLTTKIVTVTPEFCRMFGIKETETISHEVVNALLVAEDLQELETAKNRDLETAPLEVEYRINRADTGEVRWISRKAEYERDDGGRPARLVGLVRDVTDVKLAQRATEESAAQFQTFAQTLPNHVWTAPPDGLLDWFNDRVYEYSGMSRGQLDAAGWTDLVHREDLPAATEKWAGSLASGDIYETEFRLRRADGAYRWHLARALPILSADGHISRWIGTNTDIHHAKLAEAQSTRDHARIWALSQEMMLVYDFDGVIHAVNPAAGRLLGFANDEMVGRTVAEFLHPDDLEAAATQVRRLAMGAATLAFENRYRIKGGGYRLLDWTAVPYGGLIHAVARDITQERSAAADRARIWNSTNDLMATLGPDGYLTSVNPAWGRLLGYDDSQLLSQPFAALIAAEDRPKLVSIIAELKASRPVGNLEDRLVHKEGAQFLMAWSAEPVGDNFYVVGRNVTEQRAAEEALRQSQKMEAVGQLTGGIAHDFNNLLQGITGSLDLVKKRIQQGRLAELDRFISGAMTSANRAAALTHRLLAFSRRQPLDPRPVQANPLLTSMEDLLRRTMGERVKLELVLAGGLWLTKCDPNQLESAVLNLVINARDAMPDGGKLTVETCNAQLDSRYVSQQGDVQPGQYVCVAVSDTGTGMSADTVEKAFEPFFTTKPIGQGTGLGLSMIYGFAKQSEGYAKIYSEVGKGTTVHLYLPRHRGETEADQPPQNLPDLALAEANEVVLVVEDEPVVRGLIVEVLNDLGYRAIEADDGPAGLKILLSQRRIDLLISDIGLPGLNGRQIADAARESRPHLKVLFMTGYAENAAIAAGFLEVGMSMITKPFAMEALATRIHEILKSTNRAS